MIKEIIGLSTLLIGFIIGLGAVTVIDIHGILGRASSYWTRATTTAHKVTKPLIWIGIIFLMAGVNILYSGALLYVQALLFALLVLNGLFLSFVVSPFLLKQEREGRAEDILPKSLQLKITASFIFSFTGWWGSVGLFVYYLLIN